MTTRKTELEMAHEIAEYYGMESRFNQMTEEMSELIQAFCKYRRVKNGEPCRKEEAEILDNIMEEMADVYITAEQVHHLLFKGRCAEFDFKLAEKITRAYEEFKEKTEG